MKQNNIWGQAFFLLLMMVSVFLSGRRWHEYQAEDMKISAVQGMIERTVQEPESQHVQVDGSGSDSESPRIADCLTDRDWVDFEAVRRENPDVHGILRVDGTQMDYPVMWTEDREEYLNRDFYGNTSVYGSLFLDGGDRYG